MTKAPHQSGAFFLGHVSVSSLRKYPRGERPQASRGADSPPSDISLRRLWPGAGADGRRLDRTWSFENALARTVLLPLDPWAGGKVHRVEVQGVRGAMRVLAAPLQREDRTEAPR